MGLKEFLLLFLSEKRNEFVTLDKIYKAILIGHKHKKIDLPKKGRLAVQGAAIIELENLRRLGKLETFRKPNYKGYRLSETARTGFYYGLAT